MSVPASTTAIGQSGRCAAKAATESAVLTACTASSARAGRPVQRVATNGASPDRRSSRAQRSAVVRLPVWLPRGAGVTIAMARAWALTRSGFQVGEDRALLGELVAVLALVPQHASVDGDHEITAAAGPDLDARLRVLLADRSGQTGRARLVVSDDAVIDGDVHEAPSLGRGCGRTKTGPRAGPPSGGLRRAGSPSRGPAVPSQILVAGRCDQRIGPCRRVRRARQQCVGARAGRGSA